MFNSQNLSAINVDLVSNLTQICDEENVNKCIAACCDFTKPEPVTHFSSLQNWCESQ